MLELVLSSELDQGWQEELSEVAERSSIPSLLLTRDVFESISTTEHNQGALAVCEMPARLQEQAWPFVMLALDGVSDPGNLGSIIRSAAAFDDVGVIMGEGCADAYSPKAVRASAGSVLFIPSLKSDDLRAFLIQVSQEGYQLIGLEGSAEAPIWEVEFSKPTVLILGDETRGISVAVSELVRMNASIPISDKAESLNVAAAGAIALYEMARQRNQKSSATTVI